jgi:hypothetical protein
MELRLDKAKWKEKSFFRKSIHESKTEKNGKNLFMLQDVFSAVSSADWSLLDLIKKIVGFLFSQKIMNIAWKF